MPIDLSRSIESELEDTGTGTRSVSRRWSKAKQAGFATSHSRVRARSSCQIRLAKISKESVVTSHFRSRGRILALGISSALHTKPVCCLSVNERAAPCAAWGGSDTNVPWAAEFCYKGLLKTFKLLALPAGTLVPPASVPGHKAARLAATLRPENMLDTVQQWRHMAART